MLIRPLPHRFRLLLIFLLLLLGSTVSLSQSSISFLIDTFANDSGTEENAVPAQLQVLSSGSLPQDQMSVFSELPAEGFETYGYFVIWRCEGSAGDTCDYSDTQVSHNIVSAMPTTALVQHQSVYSSAGTCTLVNTARADCDFGEVYVGQTVVVYMTAAYSPETVTFNHAATLTTEVNTIASTESELIDEFTERVIAPVCAPAIGEIIVCADDLVYNENSGSVQASANITLNSKLYINNGSLTANVVDGTIEGTGQIQYVASRADIFTLWNGDFSFDQTETSTGVLTLLGSSSSFVLDRLGDLQIDPSGNGNITVEIDVNDGMTIRNGRIRLTSPYPVSTDINEFVVDGNGDISGSVKPFRFNIGEGGEVFVETADFTFDGLLAEGNVVLPSLWNIVGRPAEDLPFTGTVITSTDMTTAFIPDAGVDFSAVGNIELTGMSALPLSRGFFDVSSLRANPADPTAPVGPELSFQITKISAKFDKALFGGETGYEKQTGLRVYNDIIDFDEGVDSRGGDALNQARFLPSQRLMEMRIDGPDSGGESAKDIFDFIRKDCNFQSFILDTANGIIGRSGSGATAPSLALPSFNFGVGSVIFAITENEETGAVEVRGFGALSLEGLLPVEIPEGKTSAGFFPVGIMACFTLIDDAGDLALAQLNFKLIGLRIPIGTTPLTLSSIQGGFKDSELVGEDPELGKVIFGGGTFQFSPAALPQGIAQKLSPELTLEAQVGSTAWMQLKGTLTLFKVASLKVEGASTITVNKPGVSRYGFSASMEVQAFSVLFGKIAIIITRDFWRALGQMRVEINEDYLPGWLNTAIKVYNKIPFTPDLDLPIVLFRIQIFAGQFGSREGMGGEFTIPIIDIGACVFLDWVTDDIDFEDSCGWVNDFFAGTRSQQKVNLPAQYASRFARSPYTRTDLAAVTDDVETLVLHMNNPALNFSLIDPLGNVLTPDNIATFHPGAFGGSSESGWAYLIRSPMAGDWYMVTEGQEGAFFDTEAMMHRPGSSLVRTGIEGIKRQERDYNNRLMRAVPPETPTGLAYELVDNDPTQIRVTWNGHGLSEAELPKQRPEFAGYRLTVLYPDIVNESGVPFREVYTSGVYENEILIQRPDVTQRMEMTLQAVNNQATGFESQDTTTLPSNPTSPISVPPVFPPDPPRNIRIFMTDGVATVNWEPPQDTSNVAGYKLYYGFGQNSTFLGRGAVEGSSPVDNRNFVTATLTGLPVGRPLSIYATAYDLLGKESEPSEILLIEIEETVQMPQGLTVEATDDHEITVTWEDAANNETSYVVERAFGASENWQIVGVLGKDATEFTQGDLQCGQEYSYRVRGYTFLNGTDIYSEYTTGANTTTATCGESVTLAAPSELAVQGNLSVGSIFPTFTWQAVHDGTGAYAPVEHYNLILVDASNTILANITLPALHVCSGTLCTYTLTDQEVAIGLLNGEYNWYLRAEGAANTVSNYAGPVPFTIQVPVPEVPANVSIDEQNAVLEITLDDDPGTSWYYLEISAAGSDTPIYETWMPTPCDGVGACVLYPDVHLENGDYTLWMKAWGPAGFNELNDIARTVDIAFTRDFSAEGLTMTSSVLNANSGVPTFQWSSSPSVAWYEMWIGTPQFDTLFNAWLWSVDLNCQESANCTFTPEWAEGVLATGDYIWYLRAWNPGGLSTGDLEGWVEGQEFSVEAAGTTGMAAPQSPAGNILDTSPVFRWEAVNMASWYLVEIALTETNVPTATPGIVYSQWVRAHDLGCDTGICTLDMNLAQEYFTYGTYLWTVQAYAPAGLGEKAEAVKFIVQQ